MLNQLKEHLEKNKNRLIGKWIKKNNSYEEDICKILNMEKKTVRYWDAVWNNLYIEFKKGNSIWLDLVRYSEIVLKANKDAEQETITLFFIPNREKNKIKEIICVKTEDLINFIKLNETIAKQLIDLNNLVPRSLNAQASLTKNDIRHNIATFCV